MCVVCYTVLTRNNLLPKATLHLLHALTLTRAYAVGVESRVVLHTELGKVNICDCVRAAGASTCCMYLCLRVTGVAIQLNLW